MTSFLLLPSGDAINPSQIIHYKINEDNLITLTLICGKEFHITKFESSAMKDYSKTIKPSAVMSTIDEAIKKHTMLAYWDEIIAQFI